MFEKEIRFIHDICMNQITGLGSFVTFEELTGTELHPAILKYISAEIDLMILEDRQKLLEQSNFDYTGEEMTDAFRQVGQIIKSSKKFPIDYISNLILLAISFNANYLIRPRRTLIDFIFQKEDILNISFVKYMLNYTYYYSYIRKVFDKYTVKKALLTIPKSDFESILTRLDLEMFESHTNRLMDTALNSIADFFNIGSLSKSKIPLSALEPFLSEKNLDNYLDRLKSAFPAVTKFSYNIPDVQRVMYSTTPIKRESYLDKAAQKKVQDSVLGIEEKVVDPKKEIEESTSKTEFQEAEFTLIQETDDKDTISRLRSKNIKPEEKEQQAEEKKTEEVKKEEEPETANEYTLFDLRQEEIPEKEQVVKQPDNTEKEITEETKGKKAVNKKNNLFNTGLLEAEAADLMNMYDKEMEGSNNIEEYDEDTIPPVEVTGEDSAVNQEEEDVNINSDINDNSGDDVTEENTLPEQDEIPAVENTVEEVEIISGSDDEFIVIGEESSIKTEVHDEEEVVENKRTDPVPEVNNNRAYSELKHETDNNDKTLKNANRKYEIVRKRRIMIKKFRQADEKNSAESTDLSDQPQDEADSRMTDEETFVTPADIDTSVANSSDADTVEEEPVETIKDIFACFTEKELQRILKGVFNDDAEDFALTLDTIAACRNYDEAGKLLRSLFRSYKVKNKSKEAVILKKAISAFFRSNNDTDLI